jgi:hypothetical protein
MPVKAFSGCVKAERYARIHGDKKASLKTLIQGGSGVVR